MNRRGGPRLSAVYQPKFLRCPKCGGELKTDGINYWCVNEDWPTLSGMKIGFIKKIMFAINGQKTWIGLAVLGASLFTGGTLAVLLKYGGEAIITGGAIHKVSKGLNKIKQEKGEGEKIQGKDWLSLILQELVKFIMKYLAKRR